MTLPTLGWLVEIFRSRAIVTPDSALRICFDSRKLNAGEVFWAIEGRRDGHSFVETALQQGAAAAVVRAGFHLKNPELSAKLIHVENTSRALGEAARSWREKLSCNVVGLTGSVGKTTTKDFVIAALSSKFRASATNANFNNEIGVPLTVLETPLESLHLVCEMGAAKRGDIKHLCEIAKPDCGLVTAIGEAHLESFGSIEMVRVTKKELYDYVAETGRAFVPTSDANCVAASMHCRSKFGYGFESAPVGWKGEFLQGVNLRFDEFVRPSFEIRGENVSLAIPGQAAAQAALAAAAISLSFGVHAKDAARALSTAVPSPGRSILKRTSSLVIIDDSYNANPSSMKSAIETLSKFRTGRKVAILGDMLELGEATERSHKDMFDLLTRSGIADVSLVGENFAAVAPMGTLSFKLHLYPDSQSAAQSILEIVKPGDTVLVKGSRGIALEQVVRRLEEVYQ